MPIFVFLVDFLFREILPIVFVQKLKKNHVNQLFYFLTNYTYLALISVLDHMEQICLFDSESGLLSLQEICFFRLVQLLVKRWLQDVRLLQAHHLGRRQLYHVFFSLVGLLLGTWGVLILMVGVCLLISWTRDALIACLFVY